MNSENPVTELSTEEGLAFLSTQEIGRLAMVLGGEPDIVPVNFALNISVDNEATIYVHTAEGNKLFAAASGATLAFEVDEVIADHATSVIAYGTGRVVTTSKEADLASSAGLQSWVATYKSTIVAIDITRMSARRYRLGQPPEVGGAEVPG